MLATIRVLLVIAVGVGAASCDGGKNVYGPGGCPAAGCPTNSPAPTGPPGNLDRVVSLNDGERLDPPPPGAHPRMTAALAWQAYARRNGAASAEVLPKGASAYLATFTTSGDISHRLIYGIRLPGCHPVFTFAPPTPYPTGCVGWEILDADSGLDLDSAWEGLPNG